MRIRTFVLGLIVATMLEAWTLVLDILVLYDPAVRLYVLEVSMFCVVILTTLLIVEVQNDIATRRG